MNEEKKRKKKKKKRRNMYKVHWHARGFLMGKVQ